MIIIALSRVEEIAQIAFGRKPRRLISSPPLVPEAVTPKVSIHIPAHNEPPEMLKQTLDAVARLDYPNFECVLVINNTPDPALWLPIEEHCRTLGERFKFVRSDEVVGFKAGALRLAIVHTAADAEIIGIIDADYVVHQDWLKDLVPQFRDPAVGLVQAPQDHRDGERSVMHQAMNGEYAGFFDIGMVQRNEYNAIIVHGTMCLGAPLGARSRRRLVERHHLRGYRSRPHAARTRLAGALHQPPLRPRPAAGQLRAIQETAPSLGYGGFQILKKHWRRFLPGASRLTRDQKREFSLGWLNWLGAESLGVVVAILNILWVPVIAFLDIAVPDRILTIPILAAFAVSVAHFVALYRLRVRNNSAGLLRTMFAAMSVQWTVARAVGFGVVKEHMPFVRTAKGGVRRKTDFHAFWEAVLAGLLISGAAVLVATNDKEIREINIFAVVLVIQSLPFVAAVGLAVLERTRLNEFAYWRTLDTRFAELLGRRGTPIASAAVPAVATVPTVAAQVAQVVQAVQVAEAQHELVQ